MDLMEQIKTLLTNEIKGAEVFVSDLTGTKDHLGLMIVSDAFLGMSLLAQHQMVMKILKEKFQENLHAVQIKTMTNKAYQQSISEEKNS